MLSELLLPVLQQAALSMEVELATAAVEAELNAQEWNMQEIERIQEEQVNLISLHLTCSKTTLAWHHIRPEYSRACLTDF